MKKDEKAQIISAVTEKMKKANAIYLTEFSGMTVENSTKLRNEFRKAGVEYKVVKNTLAKKALKDANASDKLAKGLKMTTGIAFSYDDPVAPAKIIKKFMDGDDKLKFKMASVEGQIFESAQIKELSGMLSRIENIGRVAGLMMTVMQNLVYTIDQVAKQKGEAPAA
jgi:large subunit ribosomal protein L10